jgi:hypothetical protein
LWKLWCNYIATWNLKSEKLKFGCNNMQTWTTCGNKSIDLPVCINKPRVHMANFKKFKINYKGEGPYFLTHFVYFCFHFLMIRLWYYVLHCFVQFPFFCFQFKTKDERQCCKYFCSLKKHGDLKAHECYFVLLYIGEKMYNNIHFVWTHLVWKLYFVK